MTANNKHATSSQVLPVVAIPGYHIRTVLGKGGMATVYLAIQQSINREVALKILAPDHTDESFSERFLREAHIISKLTHPNIVTIYDAGVHAGYNYIAMEYIAGKNLIEAHADLSYAQKITIIRQIALALDFAGKKGYVHRDIKPENIMLAGDGRAILTDFGIARGHDIDSGLTLLGKAIGTPYFMSPEQTKGQTVDHRSDIYSLGVVLFQTLTGYVPYDGPSVVAIGIKHISDPVPSLPRFLEPFQPIINRCMAKDPAQRYQTALELHDALATISEAELDFIAAKARAVAKYNSGVQQAQTLHDTSAVSIPDDQRSSRYAELSRPFSRPGTRYALRDTTRRRTGKPLRNTLFLILLLAGCALGLFAYHSRNDIERYWLHQVQPILYRWLDVGTTRQVPDKQTDKSPDTSVTLADIPPPQAGVSTPGADDGGPGLDDVRRQIRQHKDRLRVTPNDSEARQALNALQGWYLASIEQSLQAKDTLKARKLLNAYQTDFADLDPQHFISLEKRISNIEQVLQHLQHARVYMAANAVDKPAGANALEEYLAALQLAPADGDVSAGLEAVARYFHDKAGVAWQESRLSDALSHVLSGLRARPNDSELKLLHSEIVHAIRNQRHYTELVQQADLLLKQGQVIGPQEQNAYQLYRLVLEQDPHNSAARLGLEQVENWFAGQAKQHYLKEDLLAARETVKNAQAYFPDSTRFTELKNEIDAAIEVTYPRISTLHFSAQAFRSMQTPVALDKLSPGQTLYGGFAFKNFYASGSLVEIKLLNQTGDIEYDKKTFILNTNQGESFFDLLLPAQGSPGGNYSVEFFLNDVRILKAGLSNLH